MNNFLTNDVVTVAPMTTPDTVKHPHGIYSPLFIISETAAKNRQAKVLAAAYRYIFSYAWGNHE